MSAAAANGAGCFVLVRTSNAGAAELQDAGDPPLSDRLARIVDELGAEHVGERPVSRGRRDGRHPAGPPRTSPRADAACRVPAAGCGRSGRQGGGPARRSLPARRSRTGHRLPLDRRRPRRTRRRPGRGARGGSRRGAAGSRGRWTRPIQTQALTDYAPYLRSIATTSSPDSASTIGFVRLCPATGNGRRPAWSGAPPRAPGDGTNHLDASRQHGRDVPGDMGREEAERALNSLSVACAPFSLARPPILRGACPGRPMPGMINAAPFDCWRRWHCFCAWPRLRRWSSTRTSWTTGTRPSPPAALRRRPRASRPAPSRSGRGGGSTRSS